MADTHYTRERLIENMVNTIVELEKRSPAQRDRGYFLDLVAEVANAIDGKRPRGPMKVNKEALERSVRRMA